MSLSSILTQVLMGLTVGANLILLSTGLTLVFGMMEIINFAHSALFMLGASFFLGGLKHHMQQFNPANARLQGSLLLLVAIALIMPSAVAHLDSGSTARLAEKLSLGLAVLLIATYGLGMLFSLKTHKEVFASAASHDGDEAPWPMGLAIATLAGVTVVIALVSEVFVELLKDDRKALRAYRGESALSTWLTVVAWRVATREFARRVREQETEAAIGPIESSEGESGNAPAIGTRCAVGL